ncbi:hypothetical protein [Rhodopila sp.]|uniref:hypothetical protein n=1 Tax=Rhodopila sp. TaxID=2480087 RepID=UPI003D1433F8
MINGLQLLDNVDQRLRQIQGEAAAGQSELEWLIARRDQARADEAAALRALARIRLAALGEGSVDLRRLDEADAKAEALLSRRRAEIEAAREALHAREPALAAAERERERIASALRDADANAERALSAAKQLVLDDPEWQARQQVAEAASRVAEHAEQKAAFALTDSEVKGRPYLADPLFAYLWRRGFGTPRYRSWFPVRLIDRWVARVARFDVARRDYALLTDLPKQLAGHAERMRGVAESEAAEVTEHARRIAGLPGAHEVEALRRSLDEADARLETERAAVETVRGGVSSAAAGEDALTQEAMGALEAALGQRSLQSLRAAAARTPTLEDDAIVASLEQAGAVRAEAEQMLVQRRTGVKAAQDQVRELRQVRQEMRQRGYGQSRWNFGDGAMVGMLLGELLRGAVSRGGFWDQMNRRQVPDPWGGGGRGRQGSEGGNRQGPWNLPPMHDPWGQLGGGGGLSGGFGGGGFRTGGRIGGGGGGFRTGGSF